MPFGLVLLEPVRSAEPPSSSGSAGVRSFERGLGGISRRNVLWRGGELFLELPHRRGEPLFRQLASQPALELDAACRRQRADTLGPGQAGGPAGASCAAPHLTDIGGYGERGFRPVERLARAPDLVGAKRRAMAFLAARFARRTVADDGSASDQHRPARPARLFDCVRDCVGIVSVDAHRRPAGRLEATHLIDRIGKGERPVDRDLVVIEEDNELVELEMPGKRDRLLAYALHQIAVRGEHISVVVHDLAPKHRTEMPLGNCHAHGIAEPLAKRPGRSLNSLGDEILGMARGERAQLAELLDLLDGHFLVAEQMKQRIDQHRAVSGREHEPVAIGPSGIGRVEFQETGEQHRRDVGCPHGQAGMARLGLLHGIHRERADGVRHLTCWARVTCARSS